MDTWVWVVFRNLSGNTTENDGNTLTKHHRDSSFLAKFRGGNCRYKACLHVEPFCYVDGVVYRVSQKKYSCLFRDNF